MDGKIQPMVLKFDCIVTKHVPVLSQKPIVFSQFKYCSLPTHVSLSVLCLTTKSLTVSSQGMKLPHFTCNTKYKYRTKTQYMYT